MSASDFSMNLAAEAPAEGSRVCIVRGQLAGLTGVVRAITERGSVTLEMDRLNPGVTVVISSAAVEALQIPTETL